jgi:CheY-like chemotaxis protein
MPFKKPLILLIDDDAPLRNYLRTLLAGAGYEVNAVGNGSESLRFVESHAPAAVILDLGLPDIDGQELLLNLRERLQSPIIVLSARDEPAEKIAALDHGAEASSAGSRGTSIVSSVRELCRTNIAQGVRCVRIRCGKFQYGRQAVRHVAAHESFSRLATRVVWPMLKPFWIGDLIDGTKGKIWAVAISLPNSGGSCSGRHGDSERARNCAGSGVGRADGAPAGSVGNRDGRQIGGS